jgi:hypothetical protein
VKHHLSKNADETTRVPKYCLAGLERRIAIRGLRRHGNPACQRTKDRVGGEYAVYKMRHRLIRETGPTRPGNADYFDIFGLSGGGENPLKLDASRVSPYTSAAPGCTRF